MHSRFATEELDAAHAGAGLMAPPVDPAMRDHTPRGAIRRAPRRSRDGGRGPADGWRQVVSRLAGVPNGEEGGGGHGGRLHGRPPPQRVCNSRPEVARPCVAPNADSLACDSSKSCVAAPCTSVRFVLWVALKHVWHRELFGACTCSLRGDAFRRDLHRPPRFTCGPDSLVHFSVSGGPDSLSMSRPLGTTGATQVTLAMKAASHLDRFCATNCHASSVTMLAVI